MTAADDYPFIARLVAACDADPDLKEPEAVRAFREIDRLWAEVARLTKRLADAQDADAATHDWLNQGGRIT